MLHTFDRENVSLEKFLQNTEMVSIPSSYDLLFEVGIEKLRIELDCPYLYV